MFIRKTWFDGILEMIKQYSYWYCKFGINLKILSKIIECFTNISWLLTWTKPIQIKDIIFFLIIIIILYNNNII